MYIDDDNDDDVVDNFANFHNISFNFYFYFYFFFICLSTYWNGVSTLLCFKF